ncbi:hypothetical protein GCM10009868_34820 [Terrabacter aerolatus]|uniref:ESX secretion-associated protein EspG n=1 Tax=Terrabacter aerolatus TaxID=422442 RepID=A0A512CWD6_9MICO|nr:hypothetical protein TAE01_03430 [Terrabacter aerolatus]
MLALADLHLGDATTIDAAQRESLSDAGILVDGRPHLGLRAGLEAVADPYARLEISTGNQSSPRLHHGWVDRTSALVVDQGDEGADLVEVDIAFLPATIAHLTMLQPRPRLHGRGGVVDLVGVGALLSPAAPFGAASAADLAAAAAPWPEVAECLRTAAWRLSAVDVADSRTGSTATAQVVWVDTPAGVLRVDDEPDGAILTGTTTGSIWQSLVHALPVDPVPPPVRPSA